MDNTPLNVLETTMTTHQTSSTLPGQPDFDKEKFHFKNVLAIATAHATHDTYTGFLPPLLPIIIENLSLTKTSAGLLSVFMRMPSLLQPFIGYLADRHNLRIFIILTPAISAIMMSMVGVAPSYAMAVMLLFFAGASSASLHAIAPVITGRLSGNNLGRGMSFWMVGGEFGRVLGPLVIVFAIDKLTLQHTPWIMILGILASMLLYFVLKDVPVQIPLQHESAQAIRGTIKKILKFMLPIIVLLALRSLLFAGSTMFLPTYLNGKGESLLFSGAALSVMEGAGIVGAFLGGSVSDKIGRKTIIFFSILLTPIFTFLFLQTGGWLSMALLACIGFSMLSITPAIMAMVQENFSDSRALANGIFMAVNFVTSSTGILLVGKLGDVYGLAAAINISALVLLISLPAVFFLPNHKKSAAL